MSMGFLNDSMSKPKIKRAKRIAFIAASLVETPKAYKGKTNADIEKEILEQISLIPYVMAIEKVTVWITGLFEDCLSIVYFPCLK